MISTVMNDETLGTRRETVSLSIELITKRSTKERNNIHKSPFCSIFAANVYSKVNAPRPKKSESKKAGTATAFRSKSPPRVAVSSFAAPTSSITCNVDSDGEDAQAVAVEDSDLQQTPENPVSDIQDGNTMSPLLSRSAFAECMMCFAVEEEMGSTVRLSSLVPPCDTLLSCPMLVCLISVDH